MAMFFGFFGNNAAAPTEDEVMTIPWEKNAKGRFCKLMYLRVSQYNFSGRGGVVVFFHRGVKPGWVNVCATDDLETLIEDAKDDPDIMEYERRGGVFVTWSYVKPNFRDGVVAYLQKHLDVAVLSTALDHHKEYLAEPIEVKPPV